MPIDAETRPLIQGNSHRVPGTRSLNAGDISLGVALGRNVIFISEGHTWKVFSRVSWEQQEAGADPGGWGTGVLGTGHIKCDEVVKLFQRLPCAVLKLREVMAMGLNLGDVGMDWRSRVTMRPQTSLRVDTQDLGGKAGATRMEDRASALP